MAWKHKPEEVIGNLALRGVWLAFNEAQDTKVNILALPKKPLAGHGSDAARPRHVYRTEGSSPPPGSQANC